MEDVYSLILAAGEGKRMKSQKAKVLHTICGKAFIDYVLDAAQFACKSKPIVIVGNKKEQVIKHLEGRAQIAFQDQQLGTGHAVLCAKELVSKHEGTLVILCGDAPLITGETIQEAIDFHLKKNSSATVMTAKVKNPAGYGRIVKNANGEFVKIVEQKDANEDEVKIDEINSGMYIFDIKKLYAALEKVNNKNAQGEYYLTDTIEILASSGETVSTYLIPDETEILGINDRIQLCEAGKIMQDRIHKKHMRNGVTIISPETTFISNETIIGEDTVIMPFTVLEGKCVIGSNVTIGQGSTLKDAEIGDKTNILDSVILESKVGENTAVGPFAYIRPQSIIGDHVKIGDFVEVKKSTIDNETKVSHLTYIGDSVVGKSVNFGCGTVTVNYDGTKKYQTVIKDHAFIGCNTNLVSPVTVGEGVYIAAGSTITDDIPDNAFAIARSRQTVKLDWKDKRGGKK